MIIKEKLISFKTAKLADQKGSGKVFWEGYDSPSFTRGEKEYKRPTQTLLQKWLREVHNIIVVPTIFDFGFLERGKPCYQYHIYNKTDNPEETYVGVKEYKTWEEALEEGLQEALKLI